MPITMRRSAFSLNTTHASTDVSTDSRLSISDAVAPAVRVNCVSPSLTRTRIAEPMTKSPQMADAIAKLHPIPRLGEGEDPAALADFLLSDAAGWISGQVIGVDGGRSTLRVKG